MEAQRTNESDEQGAAQQRYEAPDIEESASFEQARLGCSSAPGGPGACGPFPGGSG